MSTAPLLSIGLFLYNGDRFLEAAIESILNQTFRDFELIISDNCSTDRSGRSAAGLQPRIPAFGITARNTIWAPVGT